MVNPVETSDVEARWRPLSAPELVVAQAMLDDAWQILLLRVPLLQARLADTTLSTGAVIAVECAMVLRVLRNPDGKRQESIDDYAWTRDNTVAAGLLYLTDDELSVLAPSGASTGAFTITPYAEPDYDPALYWDSPL